MSTLRNDASAIALMTTDMNSGRVHFNIHMFVNLLRFHVTTKITRKLLRQSDIKAFRRLSSRQYLFTRGWRKRIHDDRGNKFRLHGPRALNAIRRDRWSCSGSPRSLSRRFKAFKPRNHDGGKAYEI